MKLMFFISIISKFSKTKLIRFSQPCPFGLVNTYFKGGFQHWAGKSPEHIAQHVKLSKELNESMLNLKDKSKYDAVMSALAGVIYREMRSKKTVDYRKIERDEQVQMVAEEPVKYGE